MTDLDELMALSARPPRLLSELASEGEKPSGDVEVCGISDDSRHIRPGDAFLCLPRAGIRSGAFVEQAVAAGASAVISVGHSQDTELPQLVLADVEAVGALLGRWFDTEPGRVKLIGITGTDGKTSVAWMLREAISRLDGKAWSVGTLGWMRSEGDVVDLGNTTPSLLTMHRLLAAAEDAGVAALVCEVSSHGIAQQRIAGLKMDVAIWTNLGHDHLQDHGGFAAYADIKSGFVRAVAERGGIAICNADAEEVDGACTGRESPVSAMGLLPRGAGVGLGAGAAWASAFPFGAVQGWRDIGRGYPSRRLPCREPGLRRTRVVERVRCGAG